MAWLTELGLFLRKRKRRPAGEHGVGTAQAPTVIPPPTDGQALPVRAWTGSALSALGAPLALHCRFTEGPHPGPQQGDWKQIPAGSWPRVLNTFSSVHAVRDGLMDAREGCEPPPRGVPHHLTQGVGV